VKILIAAPSKAFNLTGRIKEMGPLAGCEDVNDAEQRFGDARPCVARENREGFSIKLSALPIGTERNGVLKLLPPSVAEDDIRHDD
jgi:hypothetical protein